MSIQTSDMTDLVNATLSKYQESKDYLVDYASTLQDYPACRNLLKANRLSLDSGANYKWPIMHTADSNTRAIGYFEVNNLDQVNGETMATAEWRFVETGCMYDVKQLSVNDGGARIYNFVKAKEYQMWVKFFETMEGYFWDGPSSSSDTKTPWGLLKYALAYNATTGFNGGNHTNFSSGPYGVSTSTYSAHKHYSFQYTTVSDSDLVASMRGGMDYTNWRGIPNKPMHETSSGDQRWGIYTTRDTLASLESLLDSKNDNVGNELAKYDGRSVIRGYPIEWVPYLQTNHSTSDPVIFIDWSDARIVALENEWMRQSPYEQSGTQHDVRQRFVNCSFNFVLHNRRRHILGAKSDPMSD